MQQDCSRTNARCGPRRRFHSFFRRYGLRRHLIDCLYYPTFVFTRALTLRWPQLGVAVYDVVRVVRADVRDGAVDIRRDQSPANYDQLSGVQLQPWRSKSRRFHCCLQRAARSSTECSRRDNQFQGQVGGFANVSAQNLVQQMERFAFICSGR